MWLMTMAHLLTCNSRYLRIMCCLSIKQYLCRTNGSFYCENAFFSIQYIVMWTFTLIHPCRQWQKLHYSCGQTSSQFQGSFELHEEDTHYLPSYQTYCTLIPRILRPRFLLFVLGGEHNYLRTLGFIGC
jgi:hypothetical protein